MTNSEFEIKNTNLTLNQNKEFLFIVLVTIWTNQNNCFHFELHCLEVMVLFYLMISLYCSFVVFFLTPIALFTLLQKTVQSLSAYERRTFDL